MIYTGNFCHVQQYEQAGLTPVSIAGHAPDYYKGIQFKILAPKYTWWKEWHDKHLSNDWYRAKYQETVLNKLNPKVIANRLQSFLHHPLQPEELPLSEPVPGNQYRSK